MVLCKTSATDSLLYLIKGRHIKKTPQNNQKTTTKNKPDKQNIKILKEMGGGGLRKKINFLYVKKKNGLISA